MCIRIRVSQRYKHIRTRCDPNFSFHAVDAVAAEEDCNSLVGKICSVAGGSDPIGGRPWGTEAKA